MKQNIKINTGEYNLSFTTILKKRVIDTIRPAFIYNGIEYTWADIDKVSNKVAYDLKKLGVKKGTHIGICGTNSINWIYIFFGIIKLGAIAVLINPNLKTNEMVNICDIGGVSVLCFTELHEKETFDEYKQILGYNKTIKNIYRLNNEIDINAFIDNNNYIFENNLNGDDPCLIIYTSGSTGKPKAVLLSAYSLMYTLETLINNVDYKDYDVSLAFLPFFHVFGFISSIVAGLIIGNTYIIPSSKSPSELISLIEKYNITIFYTVPTMMLAIVKNNEFNPDRLKSLRSTILGGSHTSKEQMLMLTNILPNNHFGNIYGMSENAAISITEYNDTIEHITETVGKPIEGNILVIKDKNGYIVENGVIGEICIKSGGMLISYYNLPLDMQPIDDEGYLRTGDLGYIDKDGYIRLTGRIKDLIISGGENISPKEIEEVMFSLNHFMDVKIVGIPDEVKGEVVGAALITKHDYIFNELELKEELSILLAKYKVPVYYKVFHTFPLLGTGKIDKISIINEIINEYKKRS